jgi:hypothetical protein
MYPVANFTNYGDWVTYASLVTGNWFWPLALVGIWIVSFGTLAGFTTTERAFASSSWLTGILAGILYALGGLTDLQAIVAVALAIVGFIMLLFTKDGG